MYRNRMAGVGGTTLINEDVTPGMVTIEVYDFWKTHDGDSANNGSALASNTTDVPNRQRWRN